MAIVWLLILAGAGMALAVWPGSPFRHRLQRWRETRKRVAVEDILKHVLTRRLDGREASPESAAGHTGLSAKTVLRLVVEMESAGLLNTRSGRLELTNQGERWALQVVRAHRLWETYLAHEAHMPLTGVHKPAEAVEHHLSTVEVDRLDAALGYPRSDPHGDPIPSAAGDIAPLHAEALTNWPTGKPAIIAHVEDEPESLFRQISRRLRPGSQIRIIEQTPEHLTLTDGEQRYELKPLVAGNIQVSAVPPPASDQAALMPLSELRTGEVAEVARLAPELRGFTRRRLLDLGLTPNARVTAHLANAFGDPRAFRIRGTTIALRKDQAAHVWVRRIESPDRMSREAAPA